MFTNIVRTLTPPSYVLWIEYKFLTENHSVTMARWVSVAHTGDTDDGRTSHKSRQRGTAEGHRILQPQDFRELCARI